MKVKLKNTLLIDNEAITDCKKQPAKIFYDFSASFNKKYFLFYSALIIGIMYIFWRLFYTIDYVSDIKSTVAGLLLVLAEAYTVFMFSVFTFVTSNKKDCFSEIRVKDPNFYPSVDLLICTYNEDLKILKDTILGCKNINYPNKNIYVLDDGNRDSVKNLVKSLGCNYITRETNKGYKAGNINNALKYTNSEFLAIFDADHIPVSSFLDELVDFFADDQVAIVQTPQNFFNPDPIQKNLGLQKFISNEQDLFFRVIEPGLSHWNATVVVGTNFIVRRSIIDEIGGLSENTITEDMDLGFRLTAKGYKILYYNKPLSAGLAPENFKSYITQRIRWAKGTIQVFLDKQNLNLFKKLNVTQKVLYSAGILYYFFAFPRFVFLLFPVLFLLLGVKPIIIGFFPFLFLFQLIYTCFRMFYFIFIAKCHRHIIFSDIYETILWFPLIAAILKLIIMPSKVFKQRFSVTSKGEAARTSRSSYDLALPNLMILSLCLISIICSIFNYNNIYFKEAMYINMFWAIYNSIILLLAIFVTIEKADKRQNIRVPFKQFAKIEANSGKEENVYILDLSKTGALLVLDKKDIDLNRISTSKVSLLFSYSLPKIPLEIVKAYKKDEQRYLHVKFSFDNTENLEEVIFGTMYKDSKSW